MAEKFLKFFKLAKVDEATHEVFGVVTSEKPDGDKEIADYVESKKAFKAWSEDFLRKTTAAGQDPSLGNIRLQHSLQIAGKAIKLEFNDETKQIWLGTQPVNDDVWNLIKGGYVTGYSMGGDYLWRRPEGDFVRFAPSISEVSYVDNACNSEATFSYIKADGGMELRKFAGEQKLSKAFPLGIDIAGLVDLVKTELTKGKNGEEVHESQFAFVGDKNDKSTWQLPIHDEDHVRKALAAFDKTEGIPAEKKAEVHAQIVTAAKRFGIEVSAKAVKDELDKTADGREGESNMFEGLTDAQIAEFKKAVGQNDVKLVLEKARHSIHTMLENLHKSSHCAHDGMIAHHQKMMEMHKAHADKMVAEHAKAIAEHEDRKEEVTDHIEKMKKALGVMGGETEGAMSGERADKAEKDKLEKEAADKLAKEAVDKEAAEKAEKETAEKAEKDKLAKADMDKAAKEMVEKAEAASKKAQAEVEKLTGDLAKALEAITALTKSVDELKKAHDASLEETKTKQTLVDREGKKVTKAAGTTESMTDAGI